MQSPKPNAGPSSQRDESAWRDEAPVGRGGAARSFSPADDRVVVVGADGGSNDGTREIVAEIAARDRRVRLVANPDRLQSAGVNLAARLMADDRPWLVRVDAHADYPKNYASTLIAEARRVGAHSV